MIILSVFKRFTIISLVLFLYQVLHCNGSSIVDVRNFGAVGNGTTLNTAAIQKAIDTCQPGDTLLFKDGVFRTGHLKLKGEITYLITPSATILGSNEIEDYPPYRPEYADYWRDPIVRSLIYAFDQDNITITGGGIIDGNGGAIETDTLENDTVSQRVSGTRFYKCNHLRIENVTLRNFNCWGNILDNCDGVELIGIHVNNAQPNHHNMDGIDIQDSRNIVIEDSTIRSVDDALCLKSWSDNGIENLKVKNCVLLSTICNAFKIGTYTVGPIRNIELDHCTFISPGYSELARIGTCVSIQAVDGSDIQNLRVTNSRMINHGTPFFIRLGNRDANKTGQIGSIQDILFENITMEGVSPSDDVGCVFTGLPGYPVKNITVRNVQMKRWGSVDRKIDPDSIPESPGNYPESGMFGLSPAYGFFVRHAKNVNFENLTISLVNEDLRPWLSVLDVENVMVSGVEEEGVNRSSSDYVCYVQAESGKSICSHNELTVEVDASAENMEYLELKNTSSESRIQYIFETTVCSDIEIFSRYRTPKVAGGSTDSFLYRVDDSEWREQSGYVHENWKWLRLYLIKNDPTHAINKGLSFPNVPSGRHVLEIMTRNSGVQIDAIRLSCQQGEISIIPGD